MKHIHVLSNNDKLPYEMVTKDMKSKEHKILRQRIKDMEASIKELKEDKEKLKYTISKKYLSNAIENIQMQLKNLK